jgi:chaperonin cofactor prefoldin|nr:MAG TPA: head to tail adaptor [Caudoviricetes sp.]
MNGDNMTEEKKERLKIELEEKRERYRLYIEREKVMLTGGVQSYGIGSRNLSRYNTDLAQIRAAIKELAAEIDELEGLLANEPARKRVALVFRDW